MTLDAYLSGGPTRMAHVAEEIAFDRLQGILEEVGTADVRRKSDSRTGKR